ncbi:MAG: CDP-glycerol glycerophosphotransferase family protein [Lachnospiraceae bacterium]|nr:CDP-glycerol glycerophosphotransferase family protein [Lachnospiraceae bacterium]
MKYINRYIKYVKEFGRKYVWTFIFPRKIDNIIKRIVGYIYMNKELKDIIILESHNDFDCNGGALYSYFLNKGINERYTIVWLIKNRMKEKLPNNVYAYFLWKPSIRKAYFLANAKYIFCDDVIIGKTKEDQVLVYCTHGGVAVKNVIGKICIPDNTNYILSPGKNFDSVMCKNYSVNYPNNKMLHFGFPSNDMLFIDNHLEINKVTNYKYKRMVLWMPTFRKGVGFGRNDSLVTQPLGIPLFVSLQELEDFSNYLVKINTLLIIKIHPMQDEKSYSQLKSFRNIIILDKNSVKEKDIDNYRLMSIADALISDYSTSAYSFLLLDRPIGFTIDDIKEYKVGFIVDNLEKFMPGSRIASVSDLKEFFNNLVENKDEYEHHRTELLDWLYEYKDGQSAKRLCDYLKIC